MEILEGLLAGLRKVCGEFPDPRRGKVLYSMTKIGMAAFSPFFVQSESFLSFQRRMEEGHNGSNCQTLFGIEQILTDNHIRTLLDQVPPETLQPCFDQVIAQMQQGGGLQEFERLGGRTLIALDGTEYFCSQKLSCPQCLERKRNNRKTEHYHGMLPLIQGKAPPT